MKNPYDDYHRCLQQKTKEKDEELSSSYFQKFADEAVDLLRSLYNEREYILSKE